MKNLALEKNSYKGSVQIFTDASKTIDNKTSAAFCRPIPEFNIEHSVRLTDNKCKKLNSLKHPVRTTVAGSHN